MAMLAFGSFAFTTTVETPLAANTPAKALGTTVVGEIGDFTMPVNNRLLYGGATTRAFEIILSTSSVRSAGSQALATIHVAKNGVVVTNLSTTRTLLNTSDVGAVALCGSLSLAQNDYVEIWLETNNGTNITITKGCMIVRVLG